MDLLTQASRTCDRTHMTANRLVQEARRRGLVVASGPCEIQLERPNQTSLVRVTTYPWWPEEIRERVLRAALGAAIDALPEGVGEG